MTYIDGFVLAVPQDNKEDYIGIAKTAAPVFLKHGAIEVGENWGDDVQHGTTTDYYRAVKAEDNEAIVFSWIVWPSKAARDAGNEAAMADLMDAFEAHSKMFDAKRMIWGGFELMLESGARSDIGYVEAYLIPVPEAKKADYHKQAVDSAPIFLDLGATRIVECWSDDVSHGETTDFFRAVAAQEGESIVFSWMEYPSKAARDAANAKMMEDPRFEALGEMPFDGKRMVFSGFMPVVQS